MLAFYRACAQSTNLFYNALVDVFPASVQADFKKDRSTMILLAPDLNQAQIEQIRTYQADLQKYNDQMRSLRSAERKQILQEIANGILDDEDSAGEDNDQFGLVNGSAQPSKLLPKAPVPPSFAGQTPQAKALYFLKYFIPFLQARLAHGFIIDTVADAAGFSDHALAKTFLEKIIVMDQSQQSAIEFLFTSLGANMSVYQGYLTPPATGNYAFYLPDGPQPKAITLEDSSLNFKQIKIHRKRYWATEAIPLTSDEVYTISIDSKIFTKLQWKQDTNAITDITKAAFNAWRGFINPSTLDSYVISVGSILQPRPIVLDNSTMTFSLQQLDPERIYATDKVQLDPTKLYPLKLVGLSPTDLCWKSSSSVRSAIPVSSCLPEYSKDQTLQLFGKMKKMGLVVSHFALSSDEIVYIHSRSESTDFDNLDFNSLANITQWIRIYDYLALRKSLPAKTTRSLLDLFAWSNNYIRELDSPSNAAPDSTDPLQKAADAQAGLAKQISLATTWSELQIHQILAHANFTTGQAPQFVNEIKLLQFQKLIGYANQLGVEIPRIFEWTAPLGTNTRDFYRYADIAQDIQKMVRSKFDLEAWAAAVRPLNDTLRENQKNALIAYLLVQSDLTVPNNITNADGLFEFFLIDVQMTPLVQTSRLKQAISSIQLFVQRCMLGLEESRGVKASALDRERWQWMQKYRVWEGNRKIFLYPENWIDPSLRDDKSELFIQLEAELLQKDLSNDAVNAALRNYLYGVKQIANLQCIGLFVDFQDAGKIHVFARTRAVPYVYYYNWYSPSIDDGFWNGWHRMDVDIPHYTVPETGLVGNYVAPAVFNGSLILFVAQIMPYTIAKDPAANSSTKFDDLRHASIDDAKPITTWQVQMGWTEYRSSKWTPRQTCPITFTVPQSISQSQIDQADIAKNAADAAEQVHQNNTANTAHVAKQIADNDSLMVQATNNNDHNSMIELQQRSIDLADEFSKAQSSEKQSKSDLDAAQAAYQPLAFAYGRTARSVPLDQFQIVPSIVQPSGSAPTNLADSVKVYLTSATMVQSEAAWLYNGTQLSMLDNSSIVTLFSSRSATTSYGYSPTTIHSWQAFESQTGSATNSSSSVAMKLLQSPPDVENAETFSYQPVRTATTINTTGPSIWLYNSNTQGTNQQQFYHSIINQLLQGTEGSEPSSIFKALANLTVRTANITVLLD